MKRQNEKKKRSVWTERSSTFFFIEFGTLPNYTVTKAETAKSSQKRDHDHDCAAEKIILEKIEKQNGKYKTKNEKYENEKYENEKYESKKYETKRKMKRQNEKKEKKGHQSFSLLNLGLCPTIR